MLKSKKVIYLKPDQIILPEQADRRLENEYKLNSLAISVAANGIISPIGIRRDMGGRYILFSGRRRLAAARLVGLRRVPCIVHYVDAMQGEILALAENMQCARLHYFEEANAIDRILRSYRITDSGLATQLGLSTPALAARIRLLGLSDRLRHRITAAKLPEECAALLLRLNANEREAALEKIIDEGMNPRQSDRYIDSLLFPENTPHTVNSAPAEIAEPIRKTAIGDEKLFANSLSKLVATMQNAGVTVHLKQYHTDTFAEYKIRIIKTQSNEQLSMFN